MLDRPFYQSTIALLTVLFLVGGLAVVFEGNGPPGYEITPAQTPAPGGLPIADAQSNVGQASAAHTGLLNLNTASAAEMADALPGIGPVLSERIVAYREANGQFVRSDQLMAVAGIGPTTFEKLRDLVTVGE